MGALWSKIIVFEAVIDQLMAARSRNVTTNESTRSNTCAHTRVKNVTNKLAKANLCLCGTNAIVTSISRN